VNAVKREGRKQGSPRRGCEKTTPEWMTIPIGTQLVQKRKKSKTSAKITKKKEQKEYRKVITKSERRKKGMGGGVAVGLGEEEVEKKNGFWDFIGNPGGLGAGDDTKEKASKKRATGGQTSLHCTRMLKFKGKSAQPGMEERWVVSSWLGGTRILKKRK